MAELEKRRSRRARSDSSGSTRPRPRRATSSASRSATASSSAASGRAALRRVRSRRSTRDRGAARRGRAGGRGGRRRSPSRRRATRSRTAGRSSPAAERAKYLFRIARILQERSREFAVLESLNGGKPIRESRDVDLPLAAAHFFYYAGWADKLEYAFPNRRPRPLGVAGQIIPWNFPLLMLAWKIAPGARVREHGRAQAGRDDAADRAPLRRRPAGRPSCRPASSTSSPATAAPAPRSSSIRGVDKVAFTGSTEVGKAIQRAARRHRQAADARARRQGGEHRLRRRARSTRRSRGSSTASTSTRATSAAPARACSCRSRSTSRLVAKLKRRLTTLRVGDPLDKNTDVGAINSQDAAREDHASSSQAGKDEGAEIYQPPCRLPEKGYWFAPTVFTNVAQSYRIAQEEIFGPVLSVLTFRTPEEAVEKANNTPYGLSAGRLDGEGLAHPLDGGAAARRRRLGEHVQPLRPDLAVRRLQGVRLRPRGRAPRARAVPEVRSMSRLAGPEDLQALHRRRVPALGVGPHLRGRGAERRPRLAQGRARRRRAAARGVPEVGGRDARTTAARCSTGSPR